MAVSISTHVLDTARGKPAAGIPVALQRRDEAGDWETLHRAATDADGRAGPLDAEPDGGALRLAFTTDQLWAASGVRGFFPEVAITFEPRPGDEHLHVPLLLSPFGYSTYRGS